MLRSEKYLNHVRSRPCAWCVAPARSDAHHFGQRGTAIKASDLHTIPLCRVHHNEVHQGRLGDMRGRELRNWMKAQAFDILAEYTEGLLSASR